MTTDTLTEGAAQVAPAQPASLFERPVVSIFDAMRELRPRPALLVYAPPVTVGNMALGALIEALFESKPRLAARMLDHLWAAANVAQRQEANGERAIAARSALEWVRDIRAMVQLRDGEG